MLILPNASTWEVPEGSKVLVQALAAALDELGIPDKEAAALQGLNDVSQWNRQMHGRNGAHVSLFRIGWLMVQRKDVLKVWIRKLVEICGEGQYITNDELCRLMNLLQRITLEMEGKRTMAKADLPPVEAKEQKVS